MYLTKKNWGGIDGVSCKLFVKRGFQGLEGGANVLFHRRDITRNII